MSTQYKYDGVLMNKPTEYMNVKKAAMELKVRRGQIRDLISNKVIDYKLDNGTYVVNINSLDNESIKLLQNNDIKILIRKKNNERLLNERKIRCHEKINENNRTLEESLVRCFYENKLSSDLKNSISKNSIKEYTHKIWTNSKESDLKGKDIFNNFCDENSIENKSFDIQYYIHKLLSDYHKENNKYSYDTMKNGDYIIHIIRDVKTMDDGFYFVHKKTYEKFYEEIVHIIKFYEYQNSKYSSFKPKAYYIDLIKNKTMESIEKNNIFYLSLDEFIKTFSTKEYYERNVVYSMYFKVCNQRQENSQKIKEEVNHHTNKLHTVNGYWKRQHSGSGDNIQCRRIWINSFKRGGGEKTQKAA